MIDENERRELREAKALLEFPGLVAKLADVVGAPIEGALNRLPAGARDRIHGAAEKALRVSLEAAASTVPDQKPNAAPKNFLHKMAVGATGALGGAFGLTALAIELPVSTTLIFRTIVDIARSEGEDISDPEVKKACLEVFALGGKSTTDDAADSGYFAARAFVAQSARGGLARFLASVASRFEIVVAEKFAAQLVPVVGAVGGATVNVLFIEHFQNMARGHFIVRRLERKHGAEEVRRVYGEV